MPRRTEVLPPVVLVQWKDACQVEHTAQGPANPGLALLYEVGFLAGEDDECIQLVMEHEAEDVQPGRWRLSIPKAQIVSLDLLVRKRVRKPRPLVIDVKPMEGPTAPPEKEQLVSNPANG